MYLVKITEKGKTSYLCKGGYVVNNPAKVPPSYCFATESTAKMVATKINNRYNTGNLKTCEIFKI